MSKGLEEIKTLRGFNQVELNNDENINKSLDIIEDKLKTLKIIFEKGLSLAERDMIKQSENYEQYCIKFGWCYMKNAGNQKTEEEFNLLKRYCDEQD